MILKCNSKVNYCKFLPRINVIYAGNNIDGRIFLRCNLREKMPAIFLTLRFQAYATPPLPQILLSNILLTKTKECLSEHGLDQVKCSDLEDYFRHLSNQFAEYYQNENNRVIMMVMMMKGTFLRLATPTPSPTPLEILA